MFEIVEMDSASEDIYLQKIEEYVYDEGKLVSFLTSKFSYSLVSKFDKLYIKTLKKVDVEFTRLLFDFCAAFPRPF